MCYPDTEIQRASDSNRISCYPVRCVISRDFNFLAPPPVSAQKKRIEFIYFFLSRRERFFWAATGRWELKRNKK